MKSTKLATTLLHAPSEGSRATDQIWARAELSEVAYSGIPVSDEHLDEMLYVYGLGAGGIEVARLLPVRSQLDKALALNNPYLNLGAVANAHITSAELRSFALSTDEKLSKAAQERLDELASAVAKAATDDEFQEATVIFSKLHLETAKDLFASDAKTATLIACMSNQNALVERLHTADPAFLKRWAHEAIVQPTGSIGSGLAKFIVSNESLSVALEVALEDPKFKNRVYDAAQSVFVEAGFMPRPKPPKQRPNPATPGSLELMASMLSPTELAVMFFNTNEKVSDTLELKVLQTAPAISVANYIIGVSSRRITPDLIRKGLVSMSEERRREVASAVSTYLEEHSTLLDENPFGGELSLLLLAKDLPSLSPQGREVLFSEITTRVELEPGKWESLMVLSSEWEGTLADLVATCEKI